MVAKYIDDRGIPTDLFVGMANRLSKQLLALHNPTFYVICVLETTGDTSYWGILDMTIIPDEDVYTVVLRHLFGALVAIGENNFKGCGLVDLKIVTNRDTPLLYTPAA